MKQTIDNIKIQLKIKNTCMDLIALARKNSQSLHKWFSYESFF